MIMKSGLRALRHRNFQLFFIGQIISNTGTWMQQVAMNWLVHEMDPNPIWLGVVGFASQIPSFFLAPVAGVLVDRWNRHRLVVITQTLAMIQAFVLAGLALTGVVEVWHVLLLSVALGLINAFDMPARQAFLSEMVDSNDDLANAIALNSSMFNAARLVGPAIAAILLAMTSSGICFLINGLSYVAVLMALGLMKLHPHLPHQEHPPLWHGLREGLKYAFGFRPIRSILIQVALMSMAVMSYSTLLPIIASETLHGGAVTYGLLTTVSGVGALVGAVYLAIRKSVLGLGRWILYSSTLCGLAILGFSWNTQPWLALLLLALIGFGMMVQMGACNTLLQTIVEEDKRGRVLSLYTMAFMGLSPMGSLISGVAAKQLGVAFTLRLGGFVCLGAAALFLAGYKRLRAAVRPLYIEKGLLPEMASGVYPALAPPALPEPLVEDLMAPHECRPDSADSFVNEKVK